MALTVGVTAVPTSAAGVDLVREAERLGATSVWVPEFWGADALTPVGYLAAVTSTIRLGTAIAQLGARTPAMLAMSAQALQALSGGRFVLGVGTSGPQVMEGWHGVPFERPLARTAETIDIIRAVTSGERLSHQGEVYQLPLPGGRGRSIRSAMPPGPVPVYVASLGPANLRLTGRMADGWIGTSFLPESAEVFVGPIREGAHAVGRDPDEVELTVAVGLELTDDVEEAGRRHAAGYAFTFGAMGSATANFYNDAFTRQGWGEDVAEVQRLWLAGDRDGAGRRVPIAIGLGTNLVGTDDMVADRLRRYRDCGVTTLRVGVPGGPAGDDLDRSLADLARLLELVAEVNAEVPGDAAGSGQQPGTGPGRW